jgi:16S rRNA (cytosine967-C5)-methyltransferase
MAEALAKSPALWQQLQQVADVLTRIDDGRSMAQALAFVPAYDKPGVQAIAYAVIRHYGVGQQLVVLLVPRKPAPMTRRFLVIGLALLAQAQLALDDASAEQEAIYDAHTLVNQLVEAVRRTPKIATHSRLANAVLRQFLRQAPHYHKLALQDSRARWNHPGWWLDRLKNDYPKAWKPLLEASQYKAGLTLRVNHRVTSVASYLQLLEPLGLGARPIAEYAIQLDKAVNVSLLPGFAKGWVSVQDAGAQLAAQLLVEHLPPTPQGQRPYVLDACAAPGGKTAHILELLECDLVALEVDVARVARIHENLQRIGLSAQVICADAGRPELWRTLLARPHLFDAVLLDAPCSASGIVRRHPDIAWLRRESDVPRLAQEQAKLLEALWPLLRDGGILVYCTCSVFHSEGLDQIQSFLASHPTALALVPGLQLLPKNDSPQAWQEGKLPSDHDGFFYAVLKKVNG